MGKYEGPELGNWGPDVQDRVVYGHTVDGVSEFIYLSSKQSSHANTSTECVRRIALPAAGVVNVDLDDVMGTKRSLSLHTKFRLYSACVMTVLLGCETWTLNKRMWAKVQAFHMRCQRRILSVKWNDFIPNVTVAATHWLGQYHQHSLCSHACRLGLFGHVARFSHDVPASNILSICCASGDGYHPPPDPYWRRSMDVLITSLLTLVCLLR